MCVPKHEQLIMLSVCGTFVVCSPELRVAYYIKISLFKLRTMLELCCWAFVFIGTVVWCVRRCIGATCSPELRVAYNFICSLFKLAKLCRWTCGFIGTVVYGSRRHIGHLSARALIRLWHSDFLCLHWRVCWSYAAGLVVSSAHLFGALVGASVPVVYPSSELSRILIFRLNCWSLIELCCCACAWVSIV